MDLPEAGEHTLHNGHPLVVNQLLRFLSLVHPVDIFVIISSFFFFFAFSFVCRLLFLHGFLHLLTDEADGLTHRALALLLVSTFLRSGRLREQHTPAEVRGSVHECLAELGSGCARDKGREDARVGRQLHLVPERSDVTLHVPQRRVAVRPRAHSAPQPRR